MSERTLRESDKHLDRYRPYAKAEGSSRKTTTTLRGIKKGRERHRELHVDIVALIWGIRGGN